MTKKKKHPVLRLRKKIPPPSVRHRDKKKEADKKACREKINFPENWKITLQKEKRWL